MKIKYSIGFLVILIMSSCESSENTIIDGEYYMVGNASKVVTISDATIKINDTKEQPSSESKTFYTDKNGNMVESPNCNEIKFQIDSTDANHGIYVSAFKDEYRCYGFHLIREYQFLCVTPLKTIEGTEFHFTSPTLYTSSKTPKLNNIEKKLTILVSKNIQLNKLNYVAFDQTPNKTQNEFNKDEMTIKLDSTGINKSAIVINPMLYARKNYVAKLIGESNNFISEVPVVYHQTMNDIKSKFSNKQQKLALQKLGVSDLYLIAYRFNPGRKRVVNKIFKEQINGQVQTFELRSLKKDYE